MFFRTGPLRTMEEWRNNMDRMICRAETAESGDRAAAWVPRTDVIDDGKAYRLLLDLPGVELKEVEINVENNILTISGDRGAAQTRENEVYKRRERIFGRFERTFSLPEHIDVDGISAVGKNGVLTLTVPKKPEILPKKIEIKAS